MTDFRALCAELLAELQNAIRVIYHEDGTRHISSADPVIAKAYAALAQPAPPAEGEVGELVRWLRQEAAEQHPGPGAALPSDVRDSLLDASAKLLRAAAFLAQRHPAPVPVSERLPEFSDSDGLDRVWCWNWAIGAWRLGRINWSIHTHWLPAHALPLPAGEGE